MAEKPGWKQLREGDVLEAGTAEKFETGDWRSNRPIFNKGKCIHCYFCWAYCPDTSITLDAEDKVSGIDYKHCKGCGICAEVCPTKPEKAITMAPEEK